MSSILDFSGEVNGVVVSTTELAQHLATSGHETQIITPYCCSKTNAIYGLMILSARFFKRTQHAWFSLLILLSKFIILWRITSKAASNFTVFHAHDIISAGVFLLSRRTGSNVYFQTHFHSMPWKEFSEAGYVKPNSLAYRLLKVFSYYVMNHPDLKMIHVSEQNRALVQETFSTTQGTGQILYPGLDIVGFPQQDHDSLPYLVNVGKIDSRKNQIALVDILVELKKLGLEIPLYLVGPEDADTKAMILRKSKLKNVSSQIHFFGQQDRAATSKLLANASLYVHTSLSESIGRSLLEAIQQKTPVVALEYPAVQEILDDQAILSRDATTTEISTIISQLLSEEANRKKLQEAQYHRFQTCFTKEVMIESYNSIIKQNEF